MRRGAEIADRFEIVGREHFEAARARGKGVFVLTGHYGCWELAGYPLGRWLGKLYIVARPQNNPYIAAHFEALRESNGNVQIDRGRAGTRMLKVLKKGGAIGVAIDQRVRPSQALLVPFLGRYAWTSRLPAYLATVTGCAAVPMVCVPLPDGRYRMTFDAPILPEGEGDDEIERLTRRYAAALEPHIRARPELWLWMHSRWQRTRKQRRPEAIARLIEEAGLPAARPLHDLARSAPAERTDRAVGCARHRRLRRERPPPVAGLARRARGRRRRRGVRRRGGRGSATRRDTSRCESSAIVSAARSPTVASTPSCAISTGSRWWRSTAPSRAISIRRGSISALASCGTASIAARSFSPAPRPRSGGKRRASMPRRARRSMRFSTPARSSICPESTRECLRQRTRSWRASGGERRGRGSRRQGVTVTFTAPLDLSSASANARSISRKRHLVGEDARETSGCAASRRTASSKSARADRAWCSRGTR